MLSGRGAYTHTRYQLDEIARQGAEMDARAARRAVPEGHTGDETCPVCCQFDVWEDQGANHYRLPYDVCRYTCVSPMEPIGRKP